jgi:hypothetical protein
MERKINVFFVTHKRGSVTKILTSFFVNELLLGPKSLEQWNDYDTFVILHGKTMKRFEKLMDEFPDPCIKLKNNNLAKISKGYSLFYARKIIIRKGASNSHISANSKIF